MEWKITFGDFYYLDLFVIDGTIILNLKGITLCILAEISIVRNKSKEIAGLCLQNDMITIFADLGNLYLRMH